MPRFYALRSDVSLTPLGEFPSFISASQHAQREFRDTLLETLDAYDLERLQNDVALALASIGDAARFLTFNTGRLYSVHGQRIAASGLPDGRVAFYDVDRGIAGVTVGLVRLRQADVLEAYDLGLYHNCYSGGFGADLDLIRRLETAAREVTSVQAVAYAG